MKAQVPAKIFFLPNFISFAIRSFHPPGKKPDTHRIGSSLDPKFGMKVFEMKKMA
jgi:hypothetical protein